jgi:hypothetical protein
VSLSHVLKLTQIRLNWSFEVQVCKSLSDKETLIQSTLISVMAASAHLSYGPQAVSGQGLAQVGCSGRHWQSIIVLQWACRRGLRQALAAGYGLSHSPGGQGPCPERSQLDSADSWPGCRREVELACRSSQHHHTEGNSKAEFHGRVEVVTRRPGASARWRARI